MSLVGYGVVVVGVVLFALGYARARGPWFRYRELKAREDNAARYRAWRGGPATPGKKGASSAIDLMRREARTWATVAVVGVALVLVGFFLAVGQG